MAVVIGTTSNGGWTTIDPKRDSGTVGGNPLTWAQQFGTDYGVGTYNNSGSLGTDAGVVGDGTRFLFFSSSGSNSNKGTLASPLFSPRLIDVTETPVKARNGHPDWFLFKKGDILTDVSDISQDGGAGPNLPFGPTAYGDASNLATFYPMVMTCYDSGASNNPPLFNPYSGGALPILKWDGNNTRHSMTGNASGRGKNIAIGGINFFATKSDPNHSDYTGAVQGGSVIVFDGISQAGGLSLVEDCGMRFYGVACDSNQAYAYFRRNRMRYNISQGVHSQGTVEQALLVEENLIDCCGWYGAVAVTANTSADTFTLTSGADSTFTNAGGNQLRLKLFTAAGGPAVPAPLEAEATYWAINITGNGPGDTFQVATTRTGSAVNLTSGNGNTYYMKSAGNVVNHNNYGGYSATRLHDTEVWQEIKFWRNSMTADQEGGSFLRGGGEVINNSFSDVRDQFFGVGAGIVGTNVPVTYNVCDTANGGIFASGGDYQFGSAIANAGVDFSYNIYAHYNGWGTGTGQGHDPGSFGGSSSHNIIYDWGSYSNAENNVGNLRTFTITNAGTGGNGRVLTFTRDYTPGTGGVQSVDTIVPGTAGTGTNGVYDVIFSGGSGSGARGNVTVIGNVVTAVDLTEPGDLLYVTGDTLTSNASGLPTAWSFKIRPYTVEMRDSPHTTGTGCQAYVIVTSDGQVHRVGYDTHNTAGYGTALDGTGYNLTTSYGANPGAATSEGNGSGGLRLISGSGGTGYSTGQVLVPFSFTGGPSGGALPTGFNFIVGSYPGITRVDAQSDGLALSGGSGTGGLVTLDFTTVSGTTSITAAHPFVCKGAAAGTVPGLGSGYVAGDTCSVANVAGFTGVQVQIATVCTNSLDGTDDYNNAGKGWHATFSSPGVDRTRGTYMTWLKANQNPGGIYSSYPSTTQGYLDCVEDFQTRSTWDELLTAASYNDYIREGFGASMVGSGYATLVGGILLAALDATGTVGVSYSDSAAASGGTGPYTYAITSGSLPTSLSLNPSTGAVTGTPSVAGTYNFRITATDSIPDTGFRDYTVVISAAGGGVTISTTSLPGGTVGVAYNQTISASGGTGPYTFAVTSGSIPTGLTPLTSGGVLAGTPTVAGAYSFSVTATDSLSATSSPQAYNVTIVAAAPPSILMPQICM